MNIIPNWMKISLTKQEIFSKIWPSSGMFKTPKKSTDRAYYLFALHIIGDFGATIAIPAVLAALLGNWLDERYQKYPLFIILCLLVAFLMTIRIVQKKAKRYGEEYNKI